MELIKHVCPRTKNGKQLEDEFTHARTKHCQRSTDFCWWRRPSSQPFRKRLTENDPRASQLQNAGVKNTDKKFTSLLGSTKVSLQKILGTRVDKTSPQNDDRKSSSKLAPNKKVKGSVHPEVPTDIQKPSKYVPFKNLRENKKLSPTTMPIMQRRFVLSDPDLRESDLLTNEEDDFDDDDASRLSFSDAEGHIIEVPKNYVPIKPFPFKQQKSKFWKKCCSML
ncbi:unnamed protein product [Allacma fusca]|uniref:Uncharacterized protein n=1 Tax=Allacma fusca TaxID=39272 RepID=A0A8J2P9E1_9HEXA|nr:unnamed protein product [Allacma fusca]